MKRKIDMRDQVGTSLKTVYETFIISQSSKGVSEATIKNYHSHLKGIAKHLDIEMPFETLTKRQLEQMVVSMRGQVWPTTRLSNTCTLVKVGKLW